jgi:glycosyltransferase involved in cell wall biosynthesis
MREESFYAPVGAATTDSHQTLWTNRPLSSLKSELPPDLLCFSHLRWDFVFQRPQHLLTRVNRQTRVFFVEEPIFKELTETPRMEIRRVGERLFVATPHLPGGLSHEAVINWQRELLDLLLDERRVTEFTAWYYTPMALQFSDHLTPSLMVYDCMDELSAFRGAPPALLDWEKTLLSQVDLVFTGGQSLYEAKRDRHARVHAFPSSIDWRHFAQARQRPDEPADQVDIPGPKLGFFGVLDERFDAELLGELATRRPDWHFVLLGPVVKIAPESLPQLANIHYLGMKSYDELPRYVAHWDVALLPFALNESTRFISPTKTPEYLAAGLPVVSTPIRDVVRPYGDEGLVHIATTAAEFEQAIENALETRSCPKRLGTADKFLARTSWDKTWESMRRLMCEHLDRKELNTAPVRSVAQKNAA